MSQTETSPMGQKIHKKGCQMNPSPLATSEGKMDLNIVKLANMEKENSTKFLSKMDSKLMMDVDRSHIVENDEWMDMVEFTIPYLEKALTKEIKNIVTEEEIIKIELIKKVTVESVKHLSKHVNLVDKFNQKSGEVTPKKILNAYKEETFLTYENRFLYTLIKLIEDYMYLRKKQDDEEYKGKNHQKADYQAEVKLGKEKINVKMEYDSERITGITKTEKTAERIAGIERSLKMLKQTEVYQTLVAKKATYVKAPLKMTNVLLKNVNFQYAVKLWNYLSEQMELNDKTINESSQYEEKGIVKELVDEDIFLLYSILKKTDNSNTLKGKAKSAVEDKKLAKQLTDAMIERIIELNPDMTEKELNKLISEKILVMKTKKLISLKPVEDRFKERIEKYMIQAKEVRLK